MADARDHLQSLPVPSGEQTTWADISPLLQAACNDLCDGELIHGENFSLFAAMSALEIMDPKMDAGIENCGHHSVEEAIENGAAPIPLSSDRTLDVQCSIDVMDHLLACEATWHKGHSLAQTIFSCIYLLRLERTSSHALLHCYCRIIRATCNAVISVVSDARTHEEEDLFTMAYGLPLKGEGDEKCISILNAVEETICRQLRACKAPSSKKKVLEDIEPLQTNLDLEEGFCKALLCRLRFRKYFYHMLMCMRKPQGRGLELARKHITSCLSELSCIRRSLEFLRCNRYGSCRADIDDQTTASGCQAVGFDVNINSRLSAPTPPRAIKILSWKEAIEYYEKLLHDLDIICSFCLDPHLDEVLRFIVQFQKSRPDLVARAHLQLLLVQDGKLYGRDLIYDVIAREISLPDFLRNQEFQKNEFVVQLGQLVVNSLKILCTNAAWQRRKLGKILQDWSVTSGQLEMVIKRELGEGPNVQSDESVSMKMSKHLLIWADEQTYWVASRFLMLGFELELYSPSEYGMVYWYLYIILIKLSEKAQLKIAGISDPYEWWRNFGIDDLELQTLAIRILSQTCSSSGCERNWSVFERIHTKRRNRLEHKRLNDLVYTHYNLRLKERQSSRKFLADPISLENIDLTDEWAVEAEVEDASLLDEVEDWMDIADADLDKGEGADVAAKRKGKKKRELSRDMAKEAPLSPALLFLQCYICLSEGLAMMLAALSNEHKAFQGPDTFSTEHERFIQHFELLQKARVPENISYFLYKESTIHAHFSAVMRYNHFRDAQRISKDLRGSFSGDPDRLAELRQIDQVAEHNRIALNVINQAGAHDPSLKVSFEFSYHSCFAVAVVKRS